MTVGEQRTRGVDRVARVRSQTHVELIEKGQADVGQALLGAEQWHHLGIGVEPDAEPALVEVHHGGAKLERAAVAGVLVTSGVVRRLREGRHDVRRRGCVGVADAQADDVCAGRPACGDLALDLGEQVRRQALNALREPHQAMWSRNSSERSPW